MKKEVVLDGNLGNVLFELAHTYLSIDECSDKVVCNISQQQLKFIWQLKKAFNLQYVTRLDSSKGRMQKFEGYFQSENCFDTTKIRKLFKFSDLYLKLVDDFQHKHNVDLNDCVSMTVRRGDYITLDGIWIAQPKEYYVQAYEKYFNKKTIIMSSDDIEWCKVNFKDYPSIFLNDIVNDPVKLLCVLSYCKYSIGSSSSFSWWTAWLNEQEDSINIFPNRWYDLSKLKPNQQAPKEDIDYILPKRWIQFNTKS